MISVLLLGYRPDGLRPAQPGDIVRTLAALVPATVEGVIRDVCLLAPQGCPDLGTIADHAGCGFVDAPVFAESIRGGARQARNALVLVAQAGMMLDRGFIDEIAGLLPSLPLGRPQTYRLKAEPAGLTERLFPAMAPDAALLGMRETLQVSRAANFRQLVRALRPKLRLQSKAHLAA